MCSTHSRYCSRRCIMPWNIVTDNQHRLPTASVRTLLKGKFSTACCCCGTEPNFSKNAPRTAVNNKTTTAVGMTYVYVCTGSSSTTAVLVISNLCTAVRACRLLPFARTKYSLRAQHSTSYRSTRRIKYCFADVRSYHRLSTHKCRTCSSRQTQRDFET